MASTSSQPVVLKRPAAQQAVRPKQASTRPSDAPAPAQYEPDGDAEAESVTPEWTLPVPTSQPNWALHAVRVLQGSSHLPARLGQDKNLNLTIWSDCSGINSEMFALRELGKELRALVGVNVQWTLYCTCDSDRMSRQFAELNHEPMHVSSKMEHRNFETGQIHCEKHNTNHDMPRAGVDLYVGTYPCSPWSRRGKRTGFGHPDAQASIIGLKTIAYVSPAVFVIEIGEVPSQHALGEIMEKINEIIQASVARYTIQVVRNLTPAWSGYPTRRKRLFILGWRSDIDGAIATQPLQSLIEAPMPVEQTFLRFLRLERPVDWSRVGECPSQEELLKLSASPCQCSLDPMVCCTMHPCKCGRCGESGTECSWRRMFTNYIGSDMQADVISKKQGTLTYLQVLEMHGHHGPENPRRRLLINLFAMRPEAHPLNETLMVGDVSQNPPFGDLHTDGDTPVFTTSSSVWVFQAGQALHMRHMAALMAVDLSMVKFSKDMTESWFRQRLGLAVHVGNFGLVLMAALAPPVRACLS